MILLHLTRLIPIVRPMFLTMRPYNLPKTDPRIKAGVRTPAGIGEQVANIISMNFL